MNIKSVPMRKCVGCQEMKEKASLMRVVKTPEGNFLLDRTNRANGRGAYLCKDEKCLKLALKNKGLERSLKCKIPEEIAIELEQEM